MIVIPQHVQHWCTMAAMRVVTEEQAAICEGDLSALANAQAEILRLRNALAEANWILEGVRK